jgi:hypothetical protein
MASFLSGSTSRATAVARSCPPPSTARLRWALECEGSQLISKVAGEYSDAALEDLTPNGVCKENGCGSGADGAAGGRPNNVIICPIPSSTGRAYITVGGGGLLVADTFSTPIAQVGEYGNQVVNGAGCGGVQVGETMWLNAGVSAADGGATWSTFTVYTIDDGAFDASAALPQNMPAARQVFADPGNTATRGRPTGDPSNASGQLPGSTSRRDAHGAVSVNGAYVHVVDRIQNIIEVFDAASKARIGSYDLTSTDGQGTGVGPCEAASVSDDPGLPRNDPAPDLLESTADGRYLMIALRGPAPVSVAHTSQGSCPGVGVIAMLDGGRSGRLVAVLRSSNTVATDPVSAPGGWAYTGAERSDIHGAAVVQAA